MEKGTIHTALEVLGWIVCTAGGVLILKILSLAA
jgi:hypothetical protein